MATQNFKIRHGLNLDDHELIDSSGNLKLPAGAVITKGGAALDALPDQTGQVGKYLQTDGSTASWATVTVPTATSDLTNDSGYITSGDIPTTVSSFTNDSGYLTSETTTSISINANILSYVDEAGNTTNIDLSLYLDDSNLARIASGSVNPTTGIATFTRDDESTFDVDFSALLDDTNLVTSVNGQTGAVTIDLSGKADLTGATFTGAITATAFVGDGSGLTGISITESQISDFGSYQPAGSYAAAVHGHAISDVTGLQAALDGKVDDSQVLTNVPAGAVFTDTTYSVGNGGLTEINFTSALNTKLAGIEAGATGDQTASEILTAIKTVDGASSGLDADLLDGQHGSYYATATHNHTLDGLSNTTITSVASGEILKWNGSAWINNTLAEAGIQPAGSYLTGNQTITLTGDASGSGTTSIAVTVANDSHSHSTSTITGLGSLATLSAVGAAQITDNSVGAAELNVSGNGTAGQLLTSDGDGTMSWADASGGGGAAVGYQIYRFSASGSFTLPTDNIAWVGAIVSGSGGGGSTRYTPYSGGGGGEAIGYFDVSELGGAGATISATIGAGGILGYNGGTAGSPCYLYSSNGTAIMTGNGGAGAVATAGVGQRGSGSTNLSVGANCIGVYTNANAGVRTASLDLRYQRGATGYNSGSGGYNVGSTGDVILFW